MHPVWSEDDWVGLDRRTARAACSATSDGAALVQVVRSARQVLRTYSSSFFIVTRFLPPAKRRQVELIYAAVRYPDEIVDTFPLEPWEKRARLDLWAEHFEASLLPGDLRGQLKRGIPCFAAGFGAVVVRNGIPPEHYRAFLDAMRRDVDPPVYGTLQDLIESYIYGSAIVVGYFLAYVYGADTPARFPAALESARDLAIALQLTNFLRDVREDRLRGRVYLPADILESAGIRDLSLDNPAHLAPLHRVLVEMSAVAEDHYARAEHQLNAFAADSRVAIRACIDVYRQLNQRIGLSSEGVLARQSVPIHEKFRALPASKYWRLPLAYVGGL